jgi:hypothetical protein
VDFAEKSGPVSSLLQQFRPGVYTRVQGGTIVNHTVLMRIKSGHMGGPARRAKGNSRKSIEKTNAFCRQPIHIWG